MPALKAEIARCEVRECFLPARSRGVCARHYELRYREKLLAKPAKVKKARRSYRNNGYVMVPVPSGFPGAYESGGRLGYIAEHRKVMQQAIGRALTPGESVWFRNGRRDDSRIENLELRLHGKPVAKLLAEARAFLEIFGTAGEVAAVRQEKIYA